MKKNIKLEDITPKEYQCKEYQCMAAACHAIYEVVGKDKVVIVGSQVNTEELGIAKKVGKNEQVVMISKKMLKQIFEK